MAPFMADLDLPTLRSGEVVLDISGGCNSCNRCYAVVVAPFVWLLLLCCSSDICSAKRALVPRQATFA